MAIIDKYEISTWAIKPITADRCNLSTKFNEMMKSFAKIKCNDSIRPTYYVLSNHNNSCFYNILLLSSEEMSFIPVAFDFLLRNIFSKKLLIDT